NYIDEIRIGKTWADVTPADAVATAPTAPSITAITPLNAQLSVAFTAGADGGAAISNYQYSSDGGLNFTACSPVQTTSPIVISGLTNGTSYNVQLKAVNSVGAGTATASTAGTPVAAATAPAAPSITAITPLNAQLSVAFTAGADGGVAISNYQYSSDGGLNFTACSPVQTISPIVISGLTNGTSYNVQIKAVNSVGAGTATASTAGTPVAAATAPAAPSITAITPLNAQLSVAFTAGVDGGASISNYQYSSDGGTNFTACTPAQTTSPIVITGLTNGQSYNVQLKAVNSVGAGAATASTAGTPAVPSTLIAYEGFNGSMNSGTGWGGDWTYLYSNATLTNPGLTFGRLVTAGSKKGSFYELDRSVVSNIGDGESLFVSYIHQETAASSQFKLRSVADGDICISNGTGKLTDNSYSTFDNSHWKGDWTYNGAVLNNVVGRVTFNLIELKRTGASFSFKRWIYTDPTKLPTTMPVDNDANALTYNTWSSTFLGSLNIYGIQLIAAANIYYDEFRFGSTFASVVPLTPATAPGAPTITLVDAGGNVTFDAPVSDGGSAITGYVVNTYEAAVLKGSTVITLPSAPYTIKATALVKDHLYTFTVTATNAIGTSVESAPSAEITASIGTEFNNTELNAAVIAKTVSGIAVQLAGESNIELYNANGSLIEKTKTAGMYSRALNNGMYIIRVNGKASKFVK
ncbi:MAG: fibronectin type III domain-containing protein, partial [Paludibacter sp.]